MNSGEVYSVFSYEAQHNDELTFMINDPLTILRKGDDAEREWWWARSTDNHEGYVPRNLLGVSERMTLIINNWWCTNEGPRLFQLFPRIYRPPMLNDSD